MATSPLIDPDIDLDRIADFCRRWKVTEFALFGSVLREDFGPDVTSTSW
jgi:predicted nucleotidyltransferase